MPSSRAVVTLEPERDRRRVPASLALFGGLLMLALGTSTAAASWAAAAPLPERAAPWGPIVGAVQVRLVGTDQCLEAVPTGSTLKAARCDGGPAQAWTLEGDGSVRPASDAEEATMPQCVEVADASTTSGATVRLAACEAGPDGDTLDSQQWSVAGPSSATRLVSVVDTAEHVAPVRCLSITADGRAAALAQSCDPAHRGVWQVAPLNVAAL